MFPPSFKRGNFFPTLTKTGPVRRRAGASDGEQSHEGISGWTYRHREEGCRTWRLALAGARQTTVHFFLPHACEKFPKSSILPPESRIWRFLNTFSTVFPRQPRDAASEQQKLSNGQRCRLQRNALCVVSRPTGDEVDSEEDEEDAPVSNAPRVSTGNASNGKPNGMTRPGGPGGGGGAEGRSTIKRPSRAAASRDGPMVTGKRSERQRSGTVGPAGTVVNFDKLRTETLHKYRKHYKLDAVNDDSTTRHKLVGAIASHFVKEKVDESKVLMAFMAALSSGSTVVGGSSEDNGGGAVMTGSD